MIFDRKLALVNDVIQKKAYRRIVEYIRSKVPPAYSEPQTSSGSIGNLKKAIGRMGESTGGLMKEIAGSAQTSEADGGKNPDINGIACQVLNSCD